MTAKDAITVLRFVALVLVPGMTLYATARAIQAHGLDGLLYLWSARLQAAGDAVREYRRRMSDYARELEGMQ